MLRLLEYVARIVRRVAVAGAGFASFGPGYQPNMPEELK